MKRAKKVPLVEASFGLKWGITDKKKSDTLDPNYYLFVNRVYDNIKNDYKYHEETKNYDKDGNLEISHQFRLSKTHSTYIELAPGMIGIACSNEYSWDKFKNSIKRLVDILYSTHPTTDKIQIEIAMLGYENSIRYNPKMDFFNYIKEHLKTEIIIKDSMFDKHINSRESVDFGFFNLFPTTKPKGTFRYSIEKSDNNKNKLDWKAFVYSHNEDAPNNKKDIISWANDAHSLADDWYNKIIGK